MSLMFLILEQTITYLHRQSSSELQIFIFVFQKKKNRGGFLFGMTFLFGKHANGNYLPNRFNNLEQI